MSPFIVLADIPPSATITEALELMVVGVLIVFMGLLLVFGMIALLRKLTEKEEPEKAMSAIPPSAPSTPVATAPATTTPGSAPTVAGAIPPEIVAVITAAIVAAVNRPVRITRIAIANEHPQPVWSTQGRTSIHNSRNPRKG